MKFHPVIAPTAVLLALTLWVIAPEKRPIDENIQFEIECLEMDKVFGTKPAGEVDSKIKKLKTHD